MPTVIVEPVVKDDVEIYGEYVGRIRAQQFVEVRARVEGYLENMLFAEGTYVNKNQVLFHESDKKLRHHPNRRSEEHTSELSHTTVSRMPSSA